VISERRIAARICSYTHWIAAQSPRTIIYINIALLTMHIERASARRAAREMPYGGACRFPGWLARQLYSLERTLHLADVPGPPTLISKRGWLETRTLFWVHLAARKCHIRTRSRIPRSPYARCLRRAIWSLPRRKKRKNYFVSNERLIKRAIAPDGHNAPKTPTELMHTCVPKCAELIFYNSHFLFSRSTPVLLHRRRARGWYQARGKSICY
jgi:hypothetical protein